MSEKTFPIRYIGQRDAHVDNLYGTGLRWKRGQKHYVTREVAAYMLQHLDVYADARPQAKRDADPITPQRPSIRHLDIEHELPLANLSQMSKADMARYNALNFGEHLDQEKMTVAQMREHIRSNMRERA